MPIPIYAGQPFQANPPSPVQPVRRQPTRIVPTETILGAAGSGTDVLTLIGSNNRQDRLQIVITCMDAALYLDLRVLPGGTGSAWGAAFAQRPITFETSFDFVISNPNNSPVTVRVAEFYPDTGNLHGIAPPARQQAKKAGA